MICSVCSGRMGAMVGEHVGSQSRAISQLNSDLGPTCFCLVSVDQMEALIEITEERVSVLMEEYFPDAQDLESVELELKNRPRTDIMRAVFFKRMEYLKSLRKNMEKKRKEERKITDVEKAPKVFAFDQKEREKPVRIPRAGGGSLSDWLKDID